jgi:hypothetical protein
MRIFLSTTLFIAAIAIAIYIKIKVGVLTGLYLAGFITALVLMYMAGSLAEKADSAEFVDRLKQLWKEFEMERAATLKKLKNEKRIIEPAV